MGASCWLRPCMAMSLSCKPSAAILVLALSWNCLYSLRGYKLRLWQGCVVDANSQHLRSADRMLAHVCFMGHSPAAYASINAAVAVSSCMSVTGPLLLKQN